MIRDQLLIFADGQTVTADAITDVIDRGAEAPTLANFSPGFAGDLFLVVMTGVAFATLTSLDVRLVSDSNPSLATAPVVHVYTGAMPVADLTANKVMAILPVPPGNYKRYIGCVLDVTGTNATTGTVRAFLTNQPDFYRKMAANNPQARN